MEQGIEEEKNALREKARWKRSLVCRKKKDPAVAVRLFCTESFKEAETVFVYVSFRDEVDTHGIIEKAWEDGKKVACPRVTKQGMVFHLTTSWQDFERGYMGILEPNAALPVAVPEPGKRQLMIMPGLAFDGACRRLGYGGGYYDRYLETRRGMIPTAALAYTEQLFEKLPAAEWDFRPDMVITEEGIIYGSDENGTARPRGVGAVEYYGDIQKE